MSDLTTPANEISELLCRARAAQLAWADEIPRARFQRFGTFRHQLVAHWRELAESVQRPSATQAEILSSEIMPLADASRFLATRGRRILAPRASSWRQAAWWMGRVGVRTLREPWGTVLILGPSNYPLLLPTAQALQAIAAGNAALIKPAPGHHECLRITKKLLHDSGIPEDLFVVLDTSVATAQTTMQVGVDKVVLTGSADTGQQVLRTLADSLTPSTMELSGCDAAFVSARCDVQRAADAISYGLVLNGGATCIAPRRVFVERAVAEAFQVKFLEQLKLRTPHCSIPAGTASKLHALGNEAIQQGASIILGQLPAVPTSEGATCEMTPVVLSNVTADMSITQADVFAPVCSLIVVDDMRAAMEAYRKCPYRLGVSIFGPRNFAEHWASQIDAGCIVINDVIVPTADPRVGFGGRGKSGWGTTRGTEGLLEMTRPKTVCVRKGNWLPHLDRENSQNGELLGSLFQFFHGKSIAERFAGLKSMIREGKK